VASSDDLAALSAPLGFTAEQVERIRRGVIETDQRWVIVAAALGFAEDRDIARALAVHHGLPLAEKLVHASPPQGLTLPAASFLQARRLAPFAVTAAGVDVAAADPSDAAALRALAAMLPGPVRLHVAAASDIERALDRWSAGSEARDIALDLSSFDQGDGLDAGILRDLADRAPIIRLVDQLLGDVLNLRGSDLHVEARRDRVVARVRVDGVLRPLRELPRGTGPAVASRLKVLAAMDVANRRAPQDGRATIAIRGRSVDLRLSSVPGLYGETVAVRFLDREEVALDLSSLGLAPEIRAAIDAMIARPQGLVLVTGPTGQGKTTTLYAILRALNNGARKILTVEDPVEYELDGVTQVQVNEAAGVTFASALRAFLRQDPDILLVGEIRDAETARIAAQAALTGHLVLATLHTNDAPSAVTRLRDMGIEPYLVGSVLSGVVAQRLVRLLCTCAAPDTSPAPLRTMTRDTRSDGARRPIGCEACAQTGFRGRAAIAEAFVLEREDASAIAGGDEQLLRQRLVARGFQTLAEDGGARVGAGETSWGEVMRVAG
jgi:general secretion pathway protein E